VKKQREHFDEVVEEVKRMKLEVERVREK